MTCTLLHSTPLWVAAKAIRKCWASEGKSDTKLVQDESGDGVHLECGEADKTLIERIGNKNKHSSTLEHLVYNFDIDGISRALLQELARHRISSFSVKSTRYTLKELKSEECFYVDKEQGTQIVRHYARERAFKYLVETPKDYINDMSIEALDNLRVVLQEGFANDVAKYCLPESYKTSLAWTINARSLQNFLQLRSSPHALWEIRDLAKAVFDALPEDHKYLFEDSLYNLNKKTVEISKEEFDAALESEELQ